MEEDLAGAAAAVFDDDDPPWIPQKLKAPFPWYGGKSRAAPLMWSRLGDPRNLVIPFAGSLGDLLGRPSAPQIETINDRDCYVSNFWRAMRAAPDEVAAWADWPVNEADLHARHLWLVNRAEFRERMMTDPDFYDPKIAGWWVWGLSQWIGGGWCAVRWADRPEGPSPRRPVLTRDRGVHQEAVHTGPPKRRPHLWKGGQGTHGGEGVDVWRKRPVLHKERGVHRKPPGRGAHIQARPHIGVDHPGMGVHSTAAAEDSGSEDSGSGLIEWFRALQARLRRVRVCCGGWTRVLGPAVTTSWSSITAIILDPPYDEDLRTCDLYSEEDIGISTRVREWAVEHGKDPKLRIALCGLEGEHKMPDDWERVAWRGISPTENANNERIWFSPGCLKVEMITEQLGLFGAR